MYTQQDRDQIRQRIVKYTVITAIVVGLLLAAYVMGMAKRSAQLAYASGCMLFAAACFMWCVYLYPCIRYRQFLKDMGTGLSREMQGSVVEVSDKEEVQDGVRVLPVRIFLEEEQDERIVYLNASKAEGFPASGARVRLSCFGRHIKEVDSAQMGV